MIEYMVSYRGRSCRVVASSEFVARMAGATILKARSFQDVRIREVDEEERFDKKEKE